MAIIYGKPDSEIELLNRSPDSVKKIEDVEIIHNKLKNQLAEEKKDFFNKVPSIVSSEEIKLEKMKYEEKITEQKFDERLQQLENEKAKGGFSSVSAPLKSFFVKNYSKRKEINKIKDLQEKQLSYIKEWKENPGQIFKQTRHETILKLNEITNVKTDPFFKGAKGEVQALEKLKHLSDEFHVFCGLRLVLAYPVSYRGKRKSLRSAQMDFIVISKRGVVLIEVKNWSNAYASQWHQLRAHEQVDRAGLVLWIALKSSWHNPKNPSVTKVLLSTQGNIRYDPDYKFVSVTDLNRINYFLENGRERFSEKEVQRLVDRIRKWYK